MKSAFTPVTINHLNIPNRFVRSATFEGMADADGHATPALIEYMRRLAQQEVGLVISSHAFVAPEGRAGNWQLACDSDDCLPGLKAIAKAVHAAGGRIFLQLAHAGGQAANRETAAGPSPFAPDNWRSRDAAPCQAFDAADLAILAHQFGVAAHRAMTAGFDGVQIHAAHGYLLSQFLSGFYNRREDNYGGSLENRARLLYEVLAEVRGHVGADYPIMVKINSEDFVADGFSRADCVAVCRGLAERDIDAIELSGGIPAAAPECTPVRTVDRGETDPAYYQETAAEIKAAIAIPLLLVGGIRYPEVAEQLLADHVCDMISLSRPLVCEPELVRRWHAGDTRRADCVSCNGCFRPALTGKGIYCTRFTQK